MLNPSIRPGPAIRKRRDVSCREDFAPPGRVFAPPHPEKRIHQGRAVFGPQCGTHRLDGRYLWDDPDSLDYVVCG